MGAVSPPGLCRHRLDRRSARHGRAAGGVRVVGVVLIFREITERRKAELAIDSAREYAESIVATVREPLLILDSQLRVRSANQAFYHLFRVFPAEPEGRLL